MRGYRYDGHPAAGTAGKGGFNLADFGKELLTGFVAGGLSSAAFYGAGKAVEAVKGSVGVLVETVERRNCFYQMSFIIKSFLIK